MNSMTEPSPLRARGVLLNYLSLFTSLGTVAVLRAAVAAGSRWAWRNSGVLLNRRTPARFAVPSQELGLRRRWISDHWKLGVRLSNCAAAAGRFRCLPLEASPLAWTRCELPGIQTC